MATPTVRPYRPEDATALIEMVRTLAVIDDMDVPDDEAVARLIADLESPRPPVEVRLAEADGGAVGFAAFFMSYSTFLARKTLYLQDLYVVQGSRGIGVGAALFDEIVRVALERECWRIDWGVPRNLHGAIAFFLSFGAYPREGWVGFRLDRDQMIDYS